MMITRLTAFAVEVFPYWVFAGFVTSGYFNTLMARYLQKMHRNLNWENMDGEERAVIIVSALIFFFLPFIPWLLWLLNNRTTQFLKG